MQSTKRPSNPRRRQKTMSEVTETSPQHKEAAAVEFPVAPGIWPAEERADEPMRLCQEVVSRHQLEECADFLNKAKILQRALEIDILACDAKWTLFVSAAFSYRYDALLHPFPPQFASEQLGYDIGSLVSVIKDVPKLCIVLQILIDETYDELTGEIFELLHWVLIENADPILRSVEGEELNGILNTINDKELKIQPTHVFKVNASGGFHCDKLFKQRVQNFPLKLAFMGNKLEAYYSILQTGFPKSKDYIELSTDLQTSIQHSPYCAAWGASKCGSIISCTAICEFAFNAENDRIMANENDSSCVDISLNSPENLRLLYLIFYGRRLPRVCLPRRRFFLWIYNYRFSLSLLSYVLILLTIGVANSEKGEIFKNYVAKQFDAVVAFCRGFISRVPFNQRK